MSRKSLDQRLHYRYNLIEMRKSTAMILTISKTPKHAHSISEMFYYMGIPCYAATPSEALSEISPIYSSVIIIAPNYLADKKDYVSRLRAYADVPIFALTDSPDEYDGLISDGIIAQTSYVSKILNYLVEYTRENDRKIPGLYKLAGIDASVDLNLPIYFNKPLQFTKTETMILRVLISLYPVHLDAKNILKYAFRQSKLPENANVRTHISIMNKKFRQVTNRNLILSTPGLGYRILTPEIIDAVLK